MKSIKSDSDEQKRSSVFHEKINTGVTPQNWRLKGRQVFQEKQLPPRVSPTLVTPLASIHIRPTSIANILAQIYNHMLQHLVTIEE